MHELIALIFKGKLVLPERIELSTSPLPRKSRSISVPKNPPHPNATMVFVNWYLSKEAQEALVKSFWATGEASVSRRKDVGHPDPAFQKKVIEGFQQDWMRGKGMMTDSDEGLRLQLRVIALAKEAGY